VIANLHPEDTPQAQESQGVFFPNCRFFVSPI